MEQDQALPQGPPEHRPGRVPLRVAEVAVERRLGGLQVPVAELVPEELVERSGGLVELVGFHAFGAGVGGGPQARENPAIGQGKRGRRRAALPFHGGFGVRQARLEFLQMHEREPGRVPELVDEVAVTLHPVDGHAHVSALGGEGGQGEAEGVGAVLFHHGERIDDVALGLAHLLAVLVPDQGVDVHVVEGNLLHEVDAHHHHPGHPEEEDVEGGHQGRSGVIGFQQRRLVRPAHGGEGPEGGAEPGVQHVGFPDQLLASALGAAVRILQGHGHLLAVLAGPGRNLMPPPDLAGNAPVADVFQPVEIGPLPHVGDDPSTAVLDGGDGLVRQRFGLHEPLEGEVGLHHRAASVAMAHAVAQIIDFHQQAPFLQLGQHRLAAFEPIHARETSRLRRHAAFVVDGFDRRQIMPLPDLEVVGIVGRRHLQAAGAEFLVHVGVADDGNAPLHQRQDDGVRGQIFVAFVFGMDGHGGVAQHGFRPGGGHHDAALALGEGIANLVEMAVQLLVFHFQVGQGGVAAGAPVDDALAPVDEPLFVELDEHLADGPGQAFVHGEPLPVPVAGGAQMLELVDDGAAVFLAPFPDPFDEFLPAQGVAIRSLFRQLPLHHVLGGDAGVVGAGHPEHPETPQPLVAAEGVLEGVVQGMAHVENARDVGRRNHDAVGGFVSAFVGVKQALFDPEVVPARFHVAGLVALGQPFRFVSGDAHVALPGSGIRSAPPAVDSTGDSEALRPFSVQRKRGPPFPRQGRRRPRYPFVIFMRLSSARGHPVFATHPVDRTHRSPRSSSSSKK